MSERKFRCSLIDIFFCIHKMKPNQPHLISSSRNYVTVGWQNDDPVILHETDKTDEGEEESEERKRWYILEKRDRVQSWCRVYMGFKTQVKVGPLAPSDYHELRLKVSTGKKESDWSDTLFVATKDDIVPLTHLYRVVENGPVTSLRKILSQRPFAVDIPNKFGHTPLRLAIHKNNTNFMGILLNHGADIENCESGSGRTPLMTAALRGQLEAVQLLIEKGSSWEATDRNGLTALNYAVDNSHIEIVQYAIENGADVKVKDRFGWTSLIRGVILKSSIDVLAYLLSHGSDPNEADDRQQTALMQGVLSERPEVVQLLLSKGADTNLRNIYGHLAYDMAKSSTNEEILKIVHLLSSEPEEESKDKRKKNKIQKRKKAFL